MSHPCPLVSDGRILPGHGLSLTVISLWFSNTCVYVCVWGGCINVLIHHMLGISITCSILLLLPPKSDDLRMCVCVCLFENTCLLAQKHSFFLSNNLGINWTFQTSWKQIIQCLHQGRNVFVYDDYEESTSPCSMTHTHTRANRNRDSVRAPCLVICCNLELWQFTDFGVELAVCSRSFQPPAVARERHRHTKNICTHMRIHHVVHTRFTAVVNISTNRREHGREY